MAPFPHLVLFRLARALARRLWQLPPYLDLVRGHLPAAWLPGPVHQFKIGGDPVGQLPVAVPRTISAADQLRRSACPPDVLGQASDLLLALAAVECHVSAGGPGRVPPALLRDLVIITARLAGRTWLEARADSMAAFTELQARWPPPLPNSTASSPGC